ncbi:MAG: hypothetical protein AAFV07_16045, partial [Bacteroidota bacterium]
PEVEEARRFRALIITGDVIQLLLFLGFVYAGYRFRTRIAFHKRAMLIASILLCQQALVRIGKIPFLMIGDDPGGSGGMYAGLVPFLLLLSMLVYDLRTFKKANRMTLMGLLAYVFLVVVATLMGASGLSVRLLEGLR